MYALSAESEGGVKELLRLVKDLRPSMVVVQDQSWPTKMRIALACKRARIRVAMRSDKNDISSTARRGMPRWIEGFLVRGMFSHLAPVSTLTASYYGWGQEHTCWWFPNPSSSAKFRPTDGARSVRQGKRAERGISPTSFVFLLVAKFVPRENPVAVVRAFVQASQACRDIGLLVVGAGSLEKTLRDTVRAGGVEERVWFTGYVPYAELHEYFWASDVLVHLAESEPWGLSPQDALVAGMGLITSNRVGVGRRLLLGALQRFVVAPNDVRATAALMVGLASEAGSLRQFTPAWKEARAQFTAESLAKEWASRLGIL